MQVLVLDPTREIARRAEHVLATNGVGIVVNGSLHGLASSLSAAVADDVVIARVRSDDDGVRVTIGEVEANSRLIEVAAAFGAR